MRKITPYQANGWPRTCWGCGNPFAIREGCCEVILGPDDRLYCYGSECGDAVVASHVSELMGVALH